MEITSLGNCPSTLLTDPMAIDGDKFRAYLDATQEAGFDAVSLWAFHVMFAGDGAAAYVKDSDLTVEAVEASIGWTTGPSDALNAEIEALISTGTDLGAHIVGAACLGPIEDRGAAIEGLASIAAQAEAADMLIALEFLPWTGVPTFAAANDMCIETGQLNATVLLDTFHWVRQPGGPDLDLLRSVPGDRVAYVQLCDPSAAAEMPLDQVENEAMTARRAPGSGAVDYASIWEALDHIGSAPFVAAEVFSRDLDATGPAAMAKVIHDACRAVLPSLAAP
ncbi:MAG: sugar phosphate isomerase/epimerase [Candidatus Aldehydirespiratoraceae bacterium]|jgi:sugar phosphate isomerase/epimerase